MTPRVVVVGGGIAGLATAHHLQNIARSEGPSLDVMVWEAADRPGGKVATVRRDGFLCERGPTGWLDQEPAVQRLIESLGLGDQVLRSSDAARTRYIARKDQLHPLQMNPALFLKSPLLSRWGRLRVAAEFLVRARRDGPEESMGAFGRRRLGREFTDVLLDSMVSGIYAGDVNRISMSAAFPRIVEMETKYGGLIKALQAKRREVRERKRSGAPPRTVEAGPGGVLHSFQDGMQTPIDALARRVPITLNTAVESIRSRDTGWVLHPEHDGVADAVVLATPAPSSAAILQSIAPVAASALAQIPVAGVHVVSAGFGANQVQRDLDGFGVLIPRRERVRALGTLWTSSTFSGRAPEGCVLLTTMIGGVHDPGANQLSDDQLVDVALEHQRRMHGIEGQPHAVEVTRWPQGIPQYEVGHDARVRTARENLPAGIFLTGNSVAGVSFNQSVKAAEEVSAAVMDYLRARTAS